jgi:hypothetical protein
VRFRIEEAAEIHSDMRKQVETGVMRADGQDKLDKKRGGLHMLLFPTVLRSTRLILRLRIVGLGLLCGLVRVEIFLSAEEKHMGFRRYRGQMMRSERIHEDQVVKRTVDFVVLPPQALSDPDPPPFCF